MNRMLFAFAVLVTGVALTWGFLTVGGPETARMEKRDNSRFADLQTLGRHYECEAHEETSSDTILSPSRCSRASAEPPDLRDPLTGEAYTYIRKDENSFEVCATFEVPERSGTRRRLLGFVFEGDKGCVGYQRADEQANWRLSR